MLTTTHEGSLWSFSNGISLNFSFGGLSLKYKDNTLVILGRNFQWFNDKHDDFEITKKPYNGVHVEGNGVIFDYLLGNAILQDDEGVSLQYLHNGSMEHSAIPNNRVDYGFIKVLDKYYNFCGDEVELF